MSGADAKQFYLLNKRAMTYCTIVSFAPWSVSIIFDKHENDYAGPRLRLQGVNAAKLLTRDSPKVDEFAIGRITDKNVDLYIFARANNLLESRVNTLSGGSLRTATFRFTSHDQNYPKTPDYSVSRKIADLKFDQKFNIDALPKALNATHYKQVCEATGRVAASDCDLVHVPDERILRDHIDMTSRLVPTIATV